MIINAILLLEVLKNGHYTLGTRRNITPPLTTDPNANSKSNPNHSLVNGIPLYN